MIPQITFCINTAVNERYHLELLFRSLEQNLYRKDHEIIVYVENDNQGTVEFLKTQKTTFPDLKIVVNPLPIPLGYARNINLMFEMAKYPIVSYIQSDMVICLNYDIEVLKFLTTDTIISATRIEPPLHPPGPEKITKDFGTDPKTFQLEEFTKVAEENKTDKLTDFFFAPFTLHKKNWLDIGGHDVQFRRSREDSDILWRLALNGIKIKQCWNAIVYHFTCTSSRGNDWWKNNTRDVQIRTATQMEADRIEMLKFIHKWGSFRHPTTADEADYFKYDIGASVKNCSPNEAGVMLNLFPMFREISIGDSAAANDIKKLLGDIQKPANFLLKISDPEWDKYKKYYAQPQFEDIFKIGNYPLSTDIVVEFDIQEALQNPNMSLCLNNLQNIIHENLKEGDTGEFETDGIKIMVRKVRNVIRDNIYVKNPTFDMELEII